MCAWCEDVDCSRHARRAPKITEIGGSASPEEREFWIAVRIERLQTNAARFFTSVMRDLND